MRSRRTPTRTPTDARTAAPTAPRRRTRIRSTATGDGAGDACDRFPLDAANDADGDGRGADADNCPWTANPSQADWNANRRGDACDRASLVGIDRATVRGRRLLVARAIRPPELAATAWRLLVERRVCVGSRRRWARPRTVVGQRKPSAGTVSVALTLAPGRYRIRAVLRGARFDAARSQLRLVTVR